MTLRVVVEAHSYLVCVRGENTHCLGYVPWTMTDEAQAVLEWMSAGGMAGSTQKNWVLGSRISRCDHTLSIGDWVSPC